MARTIFSAVLGFFFLVGFASAQQLLVQSPTPGQSVAEDDSLPVKGTASPTADNKVYMWIFNARGTTPGGICRSASADVVGGAFEQKLVKEATDDPGDYTLVVQTLGPDGVYSDGQRTGDGKLFGTSNQNLQCADDAGTAGSSLNSKQGSQILSILQDYVLNRAGSDDQAVFKVVQFTVTARSVKLNPCPPSETGRNLTVTGTTNHVDGTNIIVTGSGPKILAFRNATVTGGAFSATFSASEIGQNAGTYTILADDYKGTVNTATCQVLLAAAPLPAPTPTPTPITGSSNLFGSPSPAPASPSPATPPPTPTPSPTPTPTSTPTPSPSVTPTPTVTPAPVSTPPPTPPRPSPGFDLLLALPALGAAAYLYRRRTN